MPVASITQTTGMSDFYNGTSSAPVRAAKKNLDSNDFMKLLAVQFQQQDPMKPMEDTAFIAQMAQFTSLEQSGAMTKEIARLRADQQLLMGNSYIGRTITVEDFDGKPLTGLVTSLENTEVGALLNIAGKSFPLSAVRRIEPTVTLNNPAPAPESVPPAA